MKATHPKYPSSQRGVSLIEVVVYLALFSILIGGAVVAANGIFESSGRNLAKAMVEEEGTFLVGKINWVLSGAANINTPILGDVSSSLSVTKYDNTLLTISLPPGNTMFIQKGPTTTPLNNTNTQVSSLTFTHSGTSSEGIVPEGVTARFTVTTQSSSGRTFSQNFSTTKYLRK